MVSEQAELGERQKTTRGRRPKSWLPGEVYVMPQSLGRERMSRWPAMQLTESIANPCLYLRQVSCASNPPLLPTLCASKGSWGFAERGCSLWSSSLGYSAVPLGQQAGWKYPGAGVSESILV